MQMQKTVNFIHFEKKEKILFLPISIILCLIPIEIPQKYKIEAPHLTCFQKFLTVSGLELEIMAAENCRFFANHNFLKRQKTT
jgi:hypothetical protein